MKTECDYLNGWIKKKVVTYAEISPKMVNPKDTAGERRIMIILIVIINYNNNNNRIQRHNSRFFKVQSRFFSSLCREPSPTCTLKWPMRNRVQITCNTSSAHHMQHVMLRATWCGGTTQLLSLTEFKSHLFELYFIFI